MTDITRLVGVFLSTQIEADTLTTNETAGHTSDSYGNRYTGEVSLHEVDTHSLTQQSVSTDSEIDTEDDDSGDGNHSGHSLSLSKSDSLNFHRTTRARSPAATANSR